MDGETAVIDGATMIALVAVAPETVTNTRPDVAPAGIGTTILLLLQLVGEPGIPSKLTVLVPCAPPNPLPLIVIGVPIGPASGDILEIATGIEKLTAFVTCPDTVTTNEPVVALAGTGTVMLVSLQLVGVPSAPLNVTVLDP